LDILNEKSKRQKDLMLYLFTNIGNETVRGTRINVKGKEVYIIKFTSWRNKYTKHSVGELAEATRRVMGSLINFQTKQIIHLN